MMSIRNKMLLLVIAMLVFVEVGLGGIALYEIQRLSEKYISQSLNLHCQRNGFYLNQKLDRVQSDVTAVKTVAEQMITNKKELDSSLRETLVKEMSNTFYKICGHTDYVRSYYFRFKNQFDEGFYYTRHSLREGFSRVAYKDMNDEGKNDEQFQWFYQALEKKKAVWIEPYKNNVVDKQVMSYAMPIIEDDEIIGVVGMDVNFDDFLYPIKNVHIFEKGYAFLSDGKDKLYWHHLYPYGTNYHFQMYDDLKEVFCQDSSSQMYNYQFKNKNRMLVFMTLSNGMKLILSDEVSDLYKERDLSIKSLIVICTVVAVIFCILPFWIDIRYVRPIEDIIKASHLLAEGDYDVHIDYKSKDEMGSLAESFNLTAKQLKSYFNRLENRAYRDELTGVKNQAAYAEKKKELEKMIEEGKACFGIVLVDMNNLKSINDNYGHFRGDEAIKRACKFVCDLYNHSPVYRIGGDEFVVIIENTDYSNKDVLFRQLRQKSTIHRSLEPWMQISLASGMGIYKKGDSFVNVFAYADLEMYRNKQESKEKAKKEFFK